LVKMQKDYPYEDLVFELKNTNDEASSWVKLFDTFKQELIMKFGEDSFKKDKDGEIIVATLSKEKFKALSARQVLLLYEYASHVETKLRITPDEREVLLLSGRFAAYLKTNELRELLVEHK